MEDEELRRLAEEWLERPNTRTHHDLLALLRRVAEEARQQERERIEAEVRAEMLARRACGAEYCESCAGLRDIEAALLRRIKGDR